MCIYIYILTLNLEFGIKEIYVTFPKRSTRSM